MRVGERETEGRGIGDHVPGIRRQRQRTRRKPPIASTTAKPAVRSSASSRARRTFRRTRGIREGRCEPALAMIS